MPHTTIDVTFPGGSKKYDLWCPCYDANGSNSGVDIAELAVFSAAQAATQKPATQPPAATQEPVTQPPATQKPATQPPAVTTKPAVAPPVSTCGPELRTANTAIASLTKEVEELKAALEAARVCGRSRARGRRTIATSP